MTIPEIHTPEEITGILAEFSLPYRRLSKDMYWFGLPDGYQIGSIALSQGEIICRFHYSDGTVIHNAAFPYDHDRFNSEVASAREAWKKKREKELSNMLDILD